MVEGSEARGILQERETEEVSKSARASGRWKFGVEGEGIFLAVRGRRRRRLETKRGGVRTEGCQIKSKVVQRFGPRSFSHILLTSLRRIVKREQSTPDTAELNLNYNARDRVSRSMSEWRVCRTAKLVDDWSENLRGCPQLLRGIESWGEPVHGCRSEGTFMLGYDMKWLDPPAKFLPIYWCPLQINLSQSVVERDKYRIMIFLFTLTYSQHAKQKLVETLLAFATVVQLRAL